MNTAQKWVLAIGLLLMALSALFPPRFHIGSQSLFERAFLYDGTFNAPRSVNMQKLLVEWMFLAAATAFGTVCVTGIGALFVECMEEAERNVEDEKSAKQT